MAVAMVVKNNLSALNTLNTLNKNDSAMAKSLRKVSTGMRVNGAGDDASAYSISERMQVRIRGLGQCNDNTKTGKSLLTLAERAVNEQVQVAQKLKEIALKGTDDTYSDEDRRVLQRETTQMLMQLNTISYETNYNGMPLLTGREPGEVTVYFDASTPMIDNVSAQVVPAPNGGISYTTPQYTGFTPTNPNEYLLDFSNVGSLPNSLHGEGFSILCGGCDQFVAIKFDMNLPAGTGQHYLDTSSGSGSESYVIGIQGLTTSSAVEQAVFQGIQNAKGSTNNPVQVTSRHDVVIEEVGGRYYLKKNGPEFVLYNGFKGQMVEKQGYLPWSNFYIQGDTKSSQETRLQLPNTTLNMLFPAADSDWDIVPKQGDIPTDWSSDYANLSQAERITKWENEVWPYPRKGAVASGSCVLTRLNANKFLEDIDQAIKYLLHCSTTLGAQCQRMDSMNDNIVTGHENTQASESTMRDADMAKEMVSYTKNNVLSQTAQSMLSQANQNTSSVLDILQ